MTQNRTIIFYLLGFVFGLLTALLEYFHRTKILKYNKDSFMGKGVTWNAYLMIAFGVYCGIMLIYELVK